MVIAALLLLASPPHIDPTAGRKLVWSDEFNGTGAVDRTKWNFEEGFIRNNEAQEYTTAPANSRVVDGSLVITATKDGKSVRSAALESKQSWLYGYFEFRAKIPTGRGTWPAIWFLGNSIRLKGADYLTWPNCGEMDLMENVGYSPDMVYFTMHTSDANAKGEASKGESLNVPGIWKDYHVYGLDWRPDRLDCYFDGRKVFSYTKDPKNPNSWPYDKPEFILLNLAIGGDWGGQKGIDDAIFPAEFKVDYVRVYR